MTSHAFVSPLAVFDTPILAARDFGPVTPRSGVKRLAATLDQVIRAPIGRLPVSMRAEAHRVLDGYPGPDRRFIDLFYVPIWSFLAHVPREAGLKLMPAARTAAHTAHALSLFLHLWDDHLTDNQLELDVVRLHWRTLAWMQFEEASLILARQLEDGEARIGGLVGSYLETVNRSVHAADFDTYCKRFHEQIGIWRVAPVAIGWLAGGRAAADALDSAICEFATAWRVIDDLQDLDDDLRSGQESAVFHLLEPSEKRVWIELRAALGSRREMRAWSRFRQMIEAGGVEKRVLARISTSIERAAQMADSQGWHAWAADIAQCGDFT